MYYVLVYILILVHDTYILTYTLLITLITNLRTSIYESTQTILFFLLEVHDHLFLILNLTSTLALASIFYMYSL